jgi:hypothetical protein
MVYLSYKAYQQDHVALNNNDMIQSIKTWHTRENIYKYKNKSEFTDIPRAGSHAEGIGGSTRTSTSGHGVQISVLLEVVDHSRYRKVFAVEEDDGVRGSGKKTLTDDVERSSRVVTPQKPNHPYTPSRVLRRAMVPEAPALPQPRAREVTGWRSPSSNGAVVSVFLLSLRRRSVISRKKKDRSEDSYSCSGEEKGPAGEIRRW